MTESEGNNGKAISNNNADANFESYDRLRRRIMWLIPNGIFMLGTRNTGVFNFMTLSWMTQVASEPKVVLISCEKSSLSYDYIRATSQFAVSVLNKDDKKPAIVFAKPAIYDPKESTLSGFKFFEAEVTGCPVISSAIAYLEFKVIEFRDFESHGAIFAEVINAKELVSADKKPVKDMVLSMQDTRMNYGG